MGCAIFVASTQRARSSAMTGRRSPPTGPVVNVGGVDEVESLLARAGDNSRRPSNRQSVPPNVIVPRQSGDTRMPLRPKLRHSMLSSFEVSSDLRLGLIRRMTTPGDGAATAEHSGEQPSLAALFFCYLRIGAMSFGSDMAPWIRREAVQRRAWMHERRFLAGLALSQTWAERGEPRGLCRHRLTRRPSAIVAFTGLMAIPVLFLVTAGALYLYDRRSCPTEYRPTHPEWLPAP